MIRKSAGFTLRNRNVTISNGNATKLPHRFHRSLAVSPVVAALCGALRTAKRRQKLLRKILNLSL